MARKATGQVIPPGAKARSWALRFRAYGERHYVTLGRPEDGWDRNALRPSCGTFWLTRARPVAPTRTLASRGPRRTTDIP
jgi:hypothetical protein